MKPSRKIVDGFHPRRPGTRWVQQPAEAPPKRTSSIVHKHAPHTSPSKKRSALSAKTIAPFILYGILGATAFTYQPIAELGIFVYGAVAIIKRIPSQTTFMLVFIILSAVVLTQIIGRYDLGIIFASYSFLLLIVATVCLARELRTP